MEDTLKAKLKRRAITVGSWITIGNPFLAEIMAKAGFDWLVVDMEHSAITLHEAQQLIQVIELCGVTPLVRVGENNPNLIKRVMDAGSYGVIVPMVNSKDDAIKAVNAVKYPPVGTRGVGLARAQGYGFEFEKYKKWVNKESIVIVQIEHIDAVCDIKQILGVKGVDAFMIGPYDLSASLGRAGKLDHPEVTAAIKRIKKISDESRIPSGFHIVSPDIGAVSKKIKEGYKFLAFSFDAMLLGHVCRGSLSRIKTTLRG